MPGTDFSLRTDDITQPKRTFYNRPYSNLDVSDIGRFKPKSTKHLNAAPRNPQTPSYQMPSAPAPHFPVPKLMRPSLNVSDIMGTSPSLPTDYIKTRSNRHDGAYQPRPRTMTRERLGYREPDYVFVSKRNTNPLVPVYRFPTQSADNFALTAVTQSGAKSVSWSASVGSQTFGSIDRNNPAPPRKMRNMPSQISPSLNISNIPEASVDWRKYCGPQRRDQWRDTNTTKDIDYAQANSRQLIYGKSLVTERRSNPLQPQYNLEKWIGKGTETENPVKVGGYERFLAKKNKKAARPSTVPDTASASAAQPKLPAAKQAAVAEPAPAPAPAPASASSAAAAAAPVAVAHQATSRATAAPETLGSDPNTWGPAEPAAAAALPPATSLIDPIRDVPNSNHVRNFAYSPTSVSERTLGRSKLTPDLAPTSSHDYINTRIEIGPGSYNGQSQIFTPGFIRKAPPPRKHGAKAPTTRGPVSLGRPRPLTTAARRTGNFARRILPTKSPVLAVAQRQRTADIRAVQALP